jgi:hypothetical protein
MTASASQVSGLTREVQLIHQANLKDLQATLLATTQEMAEKRTDDYFGERTFREPKGIINIFALYLTVQTCDATLGVKSFKMPPQVQKDLELLDAMRQSAKSNKSDELNNHLKEAIATGFSKERLKKLFDAPTWNMIFAGFPADNKVCTLIVSAIDALEQPAAKPTEIKTENVAKPVIDEKKRKAESKPDVPAPEKKQKEDPDLDLKVAQLLQDEELAKQLQNENQSTIDLDAAVAHQLAEQDIVVEDEISNDYQDNDAIESDREVARRLQNEENERLTQLAIKRLQKK